MSIIVTKQHKSQRKKPRFTEEEQQYARDTFEALAPYISHVCWGIDKRHTITKAEFVAYSQWCEERNRGVKKPRIIIRDENGEPWLDHQDQPIVFNYYRNYKLKLWKPEAIPPALDGDELHYYMCPVRAGKKLPYLDLDEHADWQDDLPEAIALLKDIFRDKPFYRYSHGGYNAWLKIGDAPTAAEYNAGLARMERVLKDVFAQQRIKTSIEIKGRSVWGELKSFDDRRSHLAKLPYWNYRFPCHQRDGEDKWNLARLGEFKDKPDIKWKSLMAAVDQLEHMLDPVKVEEGKRYLESLKKGGQAVVAEWASIDPRPEIKDPEFDPPSVTAPVKAVACQQSKAGDLRLAAGSPRTLEQIRQITDAFVRNREFALFASRQARRSLTADELLEQDRLHNIHNGTWEDGLGERQRRYRQIAPYVARTFDPDKCGKAESQRPILDANLREWKAKAYHFPKVAIGYVGKRAKRIERPVLIALTAIIQTASKPNGDCPRDSIQGWWEELAAENKLPAWDTDTYTAARSVLVRHRIIAIDHHRYQYVPDAKGQCKGIWIRKRKSVGERTYRCPPPISLYSLFLSPPLHNGYDVDISRERGWSGQIRESKPPP